MQILFWCYMYNTVVQQLTTSSNPHPRRLEVRCGSSLLDELDHQSLEDAVTISVERCHRIIVFSVPY